MFSNRSFLFQFPNCSDVSDCLVESIAVADFDTDGNIDVMLGVPGRSNGLGAVYLLFLNDNVTVREMLELDLITPFSNAPLVSGDRFGQAVDCLSFGANDVRCIIGASGSSLSSGIHTGRLYHATFGSMGLDSAGVFDSNFLLGSHRQDNQFWSGSLTWFADLDASGQRDIFIGTREPTDSKFYLSRPSQFFRVDLCVF